MPMVLNVMRPSGTLKFQFVFGYSDVSEQSFPYQILKISGFIFGLWLTTFGFYDTDDFKSPLTCHVHELKT